MSKPVRIRQDVIDRVGAAAESERRSLANMVEVLLLAALAERGVKAAVVSPDGGEGQNGTREGLTPSSAAPRSVSADPPATVLSVARPHMKKNRPAVECSSRAFVDGACPDCGLEE